MRYFIICLIAFSCNNDAPFRNPGDKVSAVYFNDQKFYEYTYKPDGKLDTERSLYVYSRYHYSPGMIRKEVFQDLTLSSSSAGLIPRTEWVTPENTSSSGFIRYELDANGRLTKCIYLNNFYSEFEYDSRDRITAIKMYSSVNKLSGIREYQYDERGNVIKDEHFYILDTGYKQPASVTEYEYDLFKNPFRGVFHDRIPGQGSNPNNIVREKYAVTGHPYSSFDRRYQYSYNPAGYPVSMDNGDFVTHYRYENF